MKNVNEQCFQKLFWIALKEPQSSFAHTDDSNFKIRHMVNYTTPISRCSWSIGWTHSWRAPWHFEGIVLPPITPCNQGCSWTLQTAMYRLRLPSSLKDRPWRPCLKSLTVSMGPFSMTERLTFRRNDNQDLRTSLINSVVGSSSSFVPVAATRLYDTSDSPEVHPICWLCSTLYSFRYYAILAGNKNITKLNRVTTNCSVMCGRFLCRTKTVVYMSAKIIDAKSLYYPGLGRSRTPVY